MRATNLPQLKIIVKNQTELTRSEAIYVLDMLMVLNHLKLVPQDDGSLKLIQSPDLGEKRGNTTEVEALRREAEAIQTKNSEKP